MALSSINFQKVSAHSFKHNDRTEEKTASTVHTEYSHKNICDTDSKSALQNFNELYKESISKVVGKERRADKKNTLVEAVVNIKPNTTMEDLKNLQKHIEKELGFTGLQIAIHRDEGHFEDGKFITNDHAHMSFFTLNRENGRQMFRREHITRDKLRDLQTQTANILNMDRGKSKEETGRERLNHKDWKQAKKIEAEKVKELLATKDQLKEVKKQNSSLKGQNTKNKNEKDKLKEANKALEMQLKELNTQLQKQLSNREQHAQREALVKELKEELKAKTLTAETMQTKFAELEEKLLKENEHLKSVIEVKEINNLALKSSNKALQEQKELLASKVTDLQEKINSSPNIVPQKEIIDEIQKIISEEFTKKEILESRIGKPIQAIIVKDSDSFLKRFKNIASQGVQSVANSVNSLKEEILQWKEKYNNLMEVLKSKDQKIADLEEKLQTISTKQQNQTQQKDHLEAIVEDFEANQGEKSDSSLILNKSKELTLREKFEAHREVTREQIKEVPEVQKEPSKKKSFQRQR